MSEPRCNHNQSLIATLVLPHEFYCRDRATSPHVRKFGKDLADEVTIAFSRKRAHCEPKCRIQVKKDLPYTKKNRKQTPCEPSSLWHLDFNRRSFKMSQGDSVNSGVQKVQIQPDNVCLLSRRNGDCYDDKKIASSVNKTEMKIETTDICCNLVHEIKSMLHSAVFVNRLLEDEFIQEANKDENSTRWQDYFSHFVVPSILERGADIHIMQDKYERIQRKDKDNLITRAFNAWKSTTIRFMKREVVEKIDRVDMTHFHSKKRDIFHVLACLSIGTSSRKKILQRRRDRLVRVRENLTRRLKEKNELEGIITNHMVQRELGRIFHSELCDWNRQRHLQTCFHQWKVMFHRGKDVEARAIRHLKAKIFIRWKYWSNIQVDVIDGDCYENFPNLLQAEAFYSKILFLKSFRAWKTKEDSYTNAARLQRKVLTRFIKDIINTWLQMTKESRIIKSHALREWAQYHNYTTGLPFRSWRKIAVSMREKRRDQHNFFKSYRLVKSRSIRWKIFCSWRHQARYGRVTSMYTRQDLLQLLARQNDKIDQLQSQIDYMNESIL